MIYFVLKKISKNQRKCLQLNLFVMIISSFFCFCISIKQFKKTRTYFFALCYALSYIIRLLNCLNSGKGNKLRLTHNETKKVV